ncbi:MAG: hypothetical protein ACOH2G_15520 [Ewingella sp.]
MNIWSVLGIDPTDDLSEIKRAYARKLKTARPDQDPQGYQRLREAFEGAKQKAETSAQNEFIAEFEATSSPWKMQVHVKPLTETAPVIDASLELEIRLTDTATDIIDVLMGDETEGLKRLHSILSGDLLQNLRLREVFSQELATQLSEREGLYSALLMKVSTMMAWEIDHYQPEGISIQRLASLHQQIEKTKARYYWSQLANKYQDNALNRQRFRLLTDEGAMLPWWATWVPDFLKPLNEELSHIRMHFPSLLPRLNSQLVKSLAETSLALSWGTVFLTGFWLLLIILGTRDDPNRWRDRILLILLVGIFIHGYSLLEKLLRYRPKSLVIVEGGFSLLATGVLVKMLSGFFEAFKPDIGDLEMAVTNYGVLSLVGFFVLWMMAPKKWKWYAVPLNAMNLLVTFPWHLMRKASGVAGVVAFVLLLGMYSLLIAFGIR